MSATVEKTVLEEGQYLKDKTHRDGVFTKIHEVEKWKKEGRRK